MMTHGTYTRIEAEAGGVWASPRSMIRALRGVLSPEGRSREFRQARHDMIRYMFKVQEQQRDLCVQWRL